MDEDANPIEKEEISLLRTVADIVKSSEENDEFEIFGKYVAEKMRKLSQRSDEDAMEGRPSNRNILSNRSIPFNRSSPISICNQNRRSKVHI